MAENQPVMCFDSDQLSCFSVPQLLTDPVCYRFSVREMQRVPFFSRRLVRFYCPDSPADEVRFSFQAASPELATRFSFRDAGVAPTSN